MVDSIGNIQNSYSYDDFGNTIAYTKKVENRYRYAGEKYDSITEEYYLRARYYDPATSRMLIEDSYRGDIMDPQHGIWQIAMRKNLIYITGLTKLEKK